MAGRMTAGRSTRLFGCHIKSGESAAGADDDLLLSDVAQLGRCAGKAACDFLSRAVGTGEFEPHRMKVRPRKNR